MDKDSFYNEILEIINNHFPKMQNDIFKESDLLKYINIKTKSIFKGSKSRSSFANNYALYVLIEDYVNGNFHKRENTYRDYKGAKFVDLFKRQRELPFGSKLQNHALNHRLNEEFKKYFRTNEFQPIIRDVQNSRYWINENLLKITINNNVFNIAECILKIIDKYIYYKRKTFNEFIEYCNKIRGLCGTDIDTKIDFIYSLIKPTVDARIFEIVSFAILKAYYDKKHVFIGWSINKIEEQKLILYKTGRVNANDGGIDFVMKPLGRFFQVTETIDANKYFLDIDKIQKYPITFIVKTEDSVESILQQLKKQAEKKYIVSSVVESFINCIEETINIPILLDRLNKVIKSNSFSDVINDIILYSKIEFNIEDTDLILHKDTYTSD